MMAVFQLPLLHPPLHAPPRCLAYPSTRRLHCLLSSSSSADTVSSVSSPPPLVAQDYLVSRCGLTPAQALKAAKKISKLSSPSKPDAVLAFLRDTVGVPAADIAAVVAMDASILCADVERTLAPRIADLSALGLSPDEMVRLIPLAPNSLRNSSFRRNFEFWLNELGSFDNLLLVLRNNSGLLNIDPDSVGKPNLAFLRQCGINASDIVAISKSNMYAARLFAVNPNTLREAVDRVEELGLERGTHKFCRALPLIAFMSKEAVARKIQLLRNIGFSQDDVCGMVRKASNVLGLSEKKIQRNADFLMKEVGLDLSYIAQRPWLLGFSVERRLSPRSWLLKVLKEKGLLKRELDYHVTASMTKKLFMQKFVLPYKDIVPGLADAYASKCLESSLAGRVSGCSLEK